MKAKLFHGDCQKVLKKAPAETFDAVVTDPPYELNFMSRSWDRTGVAFDPATWRAVLRVLKPGGYMLCFGGTRTYHRLACAVEDAGFEIRDCLMWLYGTGFPKGKGCLKPSWEPILLCRKPGARVEPLGIDDCRVPTSDGDEVITFDRHPGDRSREQYRTGTCANSHPSGQGRWPANIVHDGSEEVLEAFAKFGEKRGPGGFCDTEKPCGGYAWNQMKQRSGNQYPGETGTAARFYFCAKASREERGEGNTHPCVKPLKLIKWLVKLVSKPDGIILDPFMGSGTTGVACKKLGRKFCGIELDENYFKMAEDRISRAVKINTVFGE